MTCEDRIDGEMESTLADLRFLWEAYRDGDEDRHYEELGTFPEYGLCFDYVPAGTFADQKVGYFRYQIYGGPSEEFRFYTDAALNLGAVEYWFLDWFDGAHRDLTGEDFDLLEEIYEFFKEIGTVESELAKANE
jgi:hypothetical protein